MKMKYALSVSALAVMALCTGCFSSSKATNTGRKQATLPHDRQNIAVKADQKLYTPEEIKKGVVKGDWAIETVYGQPAVGEKAPFIKFVPGENMIYGNNGCNVINGNYKYNPNDSTLSFGDIATTMMLCSKEGLTDYQINTALGAVKYYSWNVKDSNYYLYLYNERHEEVMSMMHQNFQFLNGTWAVRQIGDEKIDIPDMKLVIDIDEGKLHGNTGCNVLNGRIDIDMEEANSISFSAIGTTRMTCPDIQYEMALLVALEEASHAKPVSQTEVILYDSEQKEVLRLVRTTDR